MRFRKHFDFFFREHIWVILLFLTAPVGFMGLYMWLDDRPMTDLIYYIFLSFFVLAVFLAYRFYATWNLYEMLLSDKEDLNDFALGEARCLEEEHYQKVIHQMMQVTIGAIKVYEEDRKNHKLMIYRWIHQIKTPMSVIRLIAEKHQEQQEFQRLKQAVLEMQEDLDQILNIYKMDSMETDFQAEKVPLYQLVKECINEMKSSFIQNEIYPQMKIEKKIYVFSDYKWLKFALHQLLTNAVKYSDPGTSVVIAAQEEGRRVFLSVSDTGCGIEDFDQERIFQLFFTGQNGRSRGESSGLGLYMVKRIMDFLGHTIEVESKVNEGSTFTIGFGQ